MQFRQFLESVRISDPDAFEKMTVIEGENWAKTQKQNLTSPFGFFVYLDAWKSIERQGYVGEAKPSELVLDGDGNIYGEGGYSRYTVNEFGKITLAKWSTRKEKADKAQELGFDVI
jgi:hypothetical protein